MSHVEGAEEVLRNLEGFQRKFIAGLIEALEDVCLEVSTYIKEHYQRPISGEGFTDVTGALRNSITYKVVLEGGRIVAYIFAGMDYAPHVEHVAGGIYAFMLPGFLAKKPEILKMIERGLKRRGLAA